MEGRSLDRNLIGLFHNHKFIFSTLKSPHQHKNKNTLGASIQEGVNKGTTTSFSKTI